MTKPNHFNQLSENAIDFLTRAIEGFPAQPKHSIINFYTAVELFLKARLMLEHWSLIVSKSPNLAEFNRGDFNSVSFDDACTRLRDVVQSPIPAEARKNFDTIRKHRNKMVHFFHQTDLVAEAAHQEIAREQLKAWYDLQKLLTVQWKQEFKFFSAKLVDIEKKLSRHREYLAAKFTDIQPAIIDASAKGATFIECGSCGFEAAQKTILLGELGEAKCKVCGYYDKWLNFECENCAISSPLREGGQFICDGCGEASSESELVEALNEFVVTKDNYFEASVPANCGECEGYHTVVEYHSKFLCVVCLDVSDEVSACGFCGDFNTGDMEGSYLMGCTACEGSMGWNRDKDD